MDGPRQSIDNLTGNANGEYCSIRGGEGRALTGVGWFMIEEHGE